MLNAEEQAAFEEYFRAGGGFVGVGSAIETNPGWPFLTDSSARAPPASSPRRR